MIDLGCGEGSLLSVLCQPASTIPPPPNTTAQAETPPEPTLDIHLTHLVGVDVCAESLALAGRDTAPPLTSGEAFDDLPVWERPRPRWLDLDVQIFHGGLEVLNGDGAWFGKKDGNWDAIVSTEVYVHTFIHPALAYNILTLLHIQRRTPHTLHPPAFPPNHTRDLLP